MNTVFSIAAATAIVAAVIPQSVLAAELSPVVVTATRQEARANEVLSDVTLIDREQIERVGQGSIIDLLNQQPGIQMMQNGGPGTSAQLYVRGARSDGVKVLIDGMPVNSMDITGSPLRFLPLADVERIEILRGPASALYGADAVGGVIQIFTRRGAPGLRGNAYAGAGSYGAQKMAVGMAGGNEQWRLSLQGQDERTRSISSIRNGRNRDADHDPYTNTGLSGSLSFLPTDGQEIAVSWMSNQGQVFYDSTTGTSNNNSRIDFNNEVWNLSSKNRINSIWSSTLRYGQSVDEQIVYTSVTPSPLRTTSTQYAWQNDIQLPLGKGMLALERTEQDAGPQSRFPRTTSVTMDAAQLAWNAQLDKHRWQLSGRRDENSSFGSKNTWLTSYGYQLATAWRASASAGTSFKAPTMYQLYIATNGNAALTPETGLNRELSLVWDKGQHNVSAIWYRNKLNNMIDFINTSNRYENVSAATLQGWTFAYTGKLEGWTATSSIDLLDARNDSTGKELSRRAKQKLNLALNRNWGAWSAGVESTAVGRRYNTETETMPMGGYTLFNLTARYAISKSLAIDVRANNVTDKHYTTAMTNNSYEYTALGANYFAGLRYQMQ